MIVYNLICSAGHGFEAWFKDAKAFTGQQRTRKIACPACGETKIDKVPAAPRIARGAANGGVENASEDSSREAEGRPGYSEAMRRAKDEHELMATLQELHRHVKATCDDVGDKFAEEARKIHYGEAEERGIYGETTKEEAEELADEGVPFAAIPKPPREDA